MLTFKIIYCLISLHFWQSISLELCKIISFTGDIHPRIRHQKIITSYNKKKSASFSSFASVWSNLLQKPTAADSIKLAHVEAVHLIPLNQGDIFTPGCCAAQLFVKVWHNFKRWWRVLSLQSLAYCWCLQLPETQNFKHIFLKNKMAIIIINGY